MAATDPRDSAGPTRRRFITRQHIEDAARSGSPILVSGRDVVTDEAAQRAEDLGVRIEREKPAGTNPRSAASEPAGGPPTNEAVRRAVYAAVVAELGRAPEGLAAVIDRVMTRRDR
jgi:hypothetical protein